MMAPSEFAAVNGIEYFGFEEDFVEANVRCIPMIVRFKLDEACIKLKLREWSSFSTTERIELAKKPCRFNYDITAYRARVEELVRKCTGENPSRLLYDSNPLWANTGTLPFVLETKLSEAGYSLEISQWRNLRPLQRFALLKLSQSSHEHQNLSKALREFGLL